MIKDNYLFENQVLIITTENLIIRIVKEESQLVAYSFSNANLPNDTADNFSLESENYLFSIFLKEGSSHYVSNNANSLHLCSEAIYAINESIKWKEYWL